ncbi:hypothetical protein LJR225_004824 [Phenylobacterium sp. LjRoot225]|uniref:hypothetical protein n=1 Tax=Phenylobacterium sp. LjRoot225 TaxID=3342285 RepID=UPI003ECCF318
MARPIVASPSVRRCAVALILAGAASGAVRAEMVTEPRTGLAVDPPAGFTARVAEPLSGDAQINVAADGVPLCRIVYAARADVPSQARMDALTDSVAWRERVRRQLETLYGTVTVERFEAGGLVGAVATALDERGEQATLVHVLETPRGRTTLFCVEAVAPLAARRARLDTLARAIRTPR